MQIEHHEYMFISKKMKHEYTVSVTKVLDQVELLAGFWTKEG